MSDSRKNRGGRPKGSVSAQGMHELAMLDLADAAAEMQAAVQEFAHAARRLGASRKHVARAYERASLAWMREHGDDTDPTPLAEVVPFPAQRAAA